MHNGEFIMDKRRTIIDNSFLKIELVVDDEIGLHNLAVSTFFFSCPAVNELSSMTAYLDVNDENIRFVNISTVERNRILFSITGPTSIVLVLSKEDSNTLTEYVKDNTKWIVESGELDTENYKLSMDGGDNDGRD